MTRMFLAIALLAAQPAIAQQQADPHADVRVAAPAFAPDAGPVLVIDAAHNNFHTASGRYAPMAAVARNDGYRVGSLDGPLTPAALAQIKLLVIANALAQPVRDANGARSAFTPEEIAMIHAWVVKGGALLLIADHMPFGGGADALAASFGFHFENSFALPRGEEPEKFSLSNGRLVAGPVSQGGPHDTPVTEVYCFTGTVLHAPQGATPLLRFGSGWSIVSTSVPWQFEGAPSRPSTEGDLRGAAMDVGEGRIALFSEAAMFTAQTTQGSKAGFNAPRAKQNKQYLLNLLHWLTRAS